MPQHSPVTIERHAPLFTVRINRPEQRNAVDQATAQALAAAFREFDSDEQFKVAILAGAGENFCAGADLKALSEMDPSELRPLQPEEDGHMGPSRMQLSKPVIAAIDGYCVAGGLELALWCDMRVATERAIFGVFCRRFGVPLIDGGTVRLPRLIGMSRAMDMILTGRPVDSHEAYRFGLANRIVTAENLMQQAEELALQIAGFPQQCLRNDRLGTYRQWEYGEREALLQEYELGLKTVMSGETLQGASHFAEGLGKHGEFEDQH